MPTGIESSSLLCLGQRQSPQVPLRMAGLRFDLVPGGASGWFVPESLASP
jgi:hypothetical protein